MWPGYEFLIVFRTIRVVAFKKNIFIKFNIPGSNVLLGKEFRNDRTKPTITRSATEGTDMGQLKQQL